MHERPPPRGVIHRAPSDVVRQAPDSTTIEAPLKHAGSSAREALDALGDLPPTLGVEEAGVLLGLCRSSAYRAVKNGDIPAIRINGRLFVPTAQLKALLHGAA